MKHLSCNGFYISEIAIPVVRSCFFKLVDHDCPKQQGNDFAFVFIGSTESTLGSFHVFQFAGRVGPAPSITRAIFWDSRFPFSSSSDSSVWSRRSESSIQVDNFHRFIVQRQWKNCSQQQRARRKRPEEIALSLSKTSWCCALFFNFPCHVLIARPTRERERKRECSNIFWIPLTNTLYSPI